MRISGNVEHQVQAVLITQTGYRWRIALLLSAWQPRGQFLQPYEQSFRQYRHKFSAVIVLYSAAPSGARRNLLLGIDQRSTIDSYS
jgi:hypothetical protein